MTTSNHCARPDHFYDVYGYVVRSDIALTALRATEKASFSLDIRQRPVDVSRSDGEGIDEFLRPDGSNIFRFERYEDHYLWTYPEIGAFAITNNGRSIDWCSLGGHESDVSSLLYGPIIGFALGLQGLISLHGGAVVQDDMAIGILAPSGYGKSTTVARFLSRGYSLLTDDLIALELRDGRPWVHPGYPKVKLRPDALEHHFGNAETDCLPLHLSWVDKRVVPADHLGRECTEAKALSACFVLCPVTQESPVRVVQLKGVDSLLGLLANSYNAKRMVRELALQATEWELFKTITETMAVYIVEAPRDLTRLDEVIDAIALAAGLDAK